MALITRIKSWIDRECLTHTDLNAEFSNITDNIIASGLTNKGMIERATDAEIVAGVDSERAVTPAGMLARTGTTARIGLVQLEDSHASVLTTKAPCSKNVKEAYDKAVGVIAEHSDITSSGANIEDAVTKKHAANADTALGAQSENLDMNTHKIIGVVDPTANQEAATKKYVDDNAGGGTVDVSGTPVDNDFAKFTDADTIEGRSSSETRSDLGLVIGTNVQAYDTDLTALGGLAKTNSNFIVGNGSTWVTETGSTARTSMGLGTAATRAAEDSMTDGSNLPDGHAIKTYGDANWSGGGATDKIIEGDTAVEVIDTGDGHIVFTEDGAEKARITGGKIGFGINNPGRKLHIHDANSVIQMTTPVTGSTAADGLVIGCMDGYDKPFIWNYENTDLEIATNNIVRMAIKAGGDIDMKSNKIISVADPTSPQDAATKAYGDANWSGSSGNELLSVTDYGAVGDGSTNNDSAFNDIQADSETWFYVPEGTGTYNLTNGYTFTKRYDGPGVIKIGTHKQANFNGQITSQRTVGSIGDKDAHFDGDMSQILRAEKFKLSVGANNPVPNPGSGNYNYYYETSPHFASFEIGSGVGSHQFQASPPYDGRTGITWNRVMMRHKGLGDAAVWNAYVECGDNSAGGYDPASDRRFGHSAGIILNGDVKAMDDYTYLNPLEIHMHDGGGTGSEGHKASAAGVVMNFYRTNADTSKENIWLGCRMQSESSRYDVSKSCDAAFSVAGKWFRGLDLVPATFSASKAAITMKANDRIYFSSTGNNWWCTTPGADYISYNSAISKIYVSTDLYVNGNISASGTVGTSDHGALTGLADDDHSQYHNNARGDARYIRTLADTTVAANTKWNDNYHARFGTGCDMDIYHSGTNAMIANSTGYIAIKPTTDKVLLFYAGAEKLRTTNTGITVTGSCTGCDYVFEDNYKLLSLDNLDKFVRKTKHLPDLTIAQGQEIAFDKMRQELVVKVEEQALYILQLHKRLKKLENYNKRLDKTP